MEDFGGLGDVGTVAAGLLLGLDPALLHVVGLSLAVSLAATLGATAVGVPFGIAMAALKIPGRRALVLGANALLGLPPVLVGLVLYVMLSRAGPLGGLGLLFTPVAMVIAQFLLALPIIVALAHRAATGIWRVYGDDLRVSGAGPLQSIRTVLAIGRLDMLTAVLAGFGRTISEVGAIMIVGGNIAGVTRTMTTSIMLETSRGRFGFAVALGLVLVTISLLVSAVAFRLAGDRLEKPPIEPSRARLA